MKKLIKTLVQSLWFWLALPVALGLAGQVTQQINNGSGVVLPSYNYQMTQCPLGQCSNTAIVDGTSGANLVSVDSNALHTQGQGSAGSAIVANPVRTGCRAQTGETLTTTDGNAMEEACDVSGKRIISPFANKELWLDGSASAATTLSTTLIAAQGPTKKIYVTGLDCSNTGVTSTPITINNTGNWSQLVPAGSGFIKTFGTPLVVAANTVLRFQASLTSTSILCNAQAFSGN